jgi:hypothetical protein
MGDGSIRQRLQTALAPRAMAAGAQATFTPLGLTAAERAAVDENLAILLGHAAILAAALPDEAAADPEGFRP